MLETTGALISLCGSLFLFLGGLGVVRMPDVYNRMQAGTKATTLGSLLFLAGIAVASPAWAPRLAILAIFLLITNPVSTHALARAAHNARVALAKVSVKDALAQDEEASK